MRKKGLQHRYFTVLIQLNMIDENCGGTEVWSKDLHRGDLVRTRYALNLYSTSILLPFTFFDDFPIYSHIFYFI